MKLATLRTLATAAILCAPCAAPAAEEPEAVYAKFHRAAISRNLEELFRYGPAERRAELASMSDAQKEAALKMAASMMPRAFVVKNKVVNPGGRTARLVVSGTGENLVAGRPETLYGEIMLVMERGEWKVDESNWSNEPPANVAAATKAAPVKATKPQAAPLTRSPAAAPAPARPLGTAKPPCVYKAVMTAEDVENCK